VVWRQGDEVRDKWARGEFLSLSSADSALAFEVLRTQLEEVSADSQGQREAEVTTGACVFKSARLAFAKPGAHS
jgi:hypothetical protein